MTDRLIQGPWPYLLLTLLCLALYLPGIASLPPVDRDEPRYAQASRQMVETGDYVRIRFLDVPRHKKPIGIYWLQAAAVKLTGAKDEIWPYRIPSVLGGIAAVLFTFAMGRRLFDGRTALAAAALLAACPLLVTVTHAATTDAVLLATVAAAQAALAAVYLRGTAGERVPWTVPLLFWTAQGLGLLVKGPLTPFISLLTVLALAWRERGFRWAKGLRPLWGMPLMLLLAVPWLVAVQIATNGEFLRQALGEDFGPKLISGQQGHGAPPGVYLLLSNVALWPVILAVWAGLLAAWRERRASRPLAFCLAWAVPAWLVLELIPTKLPHYVLPTYPALLLLAAAAATEARKLPEGAVWRWLSGVVSVIWWVVAVVLVAAVPLMGWFLDGRVSPAAFIPAMVALTGCVVLWRWRFGGRLRLAAAAVLFALLYFVPLFGVVVPGFDNLWVSRKAGAMVRAYERELGRPVTVAASGYEEASLAFTLGTRTRLELPVKGVVAELQAHPDTVALLQDHAPQPPFPLPLPETWQAFLRRKLEVKPSSRCEAKFLTLAAAAGLHVRKAGEISGFNHSNGRRLRVVMYTVEPSAATP